MNASNSNLAIRNAVCIALIIFVLVTVAIVYPMVKAEALSFINQASLTTLP